MNGFLYVILTPLRICTRKPIHVQTNNVETDANSDATIVTVETGGDEQCDALPGSVQPPPPPQTLSLIGGRCTRCNSDLQDAYMYMDNAYCSHACRYKACRVVA